MNIPTDEECERLLDYYCMPDNVRAHSEKVKKIAVLIAGELVKKGFDINVELVKKAAILHDIAKVIDFHEFPDAEKRCIETWKNLKKRFLGLNHTQAVMYLLSDYPEVADVIRRHAYKAVIDEKYYPYSWEAKIVTYADKRVAHDQVVSLKYRFEEGHKRWQKKGKSYDEELIRKINDEYFRIEEEIFSQLDMNPEKIAECID